MLLRTASGCVKFQLCNFTIIESIIHQNSAHAAVLRHSELVILKRDSYESVWLLDISVHFDRCLHNLSSAHRDSTCSLGNLDFHAASTNCDAVTHNYTNGNAAAFGARF